MKAITGTWGAWCGGAARRRASFYAWRDGLTLPGRAALSLAGAGFIGLCAQVIVPLPFTPVPLSLSTFAVAATAVTLGRGWGTLSVGFYVMLAALGMPWLTGGRGGFEAIAAAVPTAWPPTAQVPITRVLPSAILLVEISRPAIIKFWMFFE